MWKIGEVNDSEATTTVLQIFQLINIHIYFCLYFSTDEDFEDVALASPDDIIFKQPLSPYKVILQLFVNNIRLYFKRQMFEIFY